MNWKGYGFLLALALVSLAELNVAVASTAIPPDLIGTWDFASMSPLKDGKPFGTIQFKPGQWSLQLNQDGTYVEKMPFEKLAKNLITSVDLLRLRLLGLGSPQDQDVGQ